MIFNLYIYIYIYIYEIQHNLEKMHTHPVNNAKIWSEIGIARKTNGTNSEERINTNQIY